MGLVDSLKDLFKDPGTVTHDDVINEFKSRYPIYDKVPNDELARDMSSKLQQDYGFLTGYKGSEPVPAPLVPKGLRNEDFYFANPEVAHKDAVSQVQDFKKEHPMYHEFPDAELASDMERVFPDRFKNISKFIQFDPSAPPIKPSNSFKDLVTTEGDKALKIGQQAVNHIKDNATTAENHLLTTLIQAPKDYFKGDLFPGVHLPLEFTKDFVIAGAAQVAGVYQGLTGQELKLDDQSLKGLADRKISPEIAKTSGEMVGGLALLGGTAAVLKTAQAGEYVTQLFARSPQIARMLGAGVRAGAEFGGAGGLQEAFKQVGDGKIDLKAFGHRVLEDTAIGIGFGGVQAGTAGKLKGAIPDALLQTAGGSAYGFGVSLAQGHDLATAATSGGLAGLYALAGAKDATEAQKVGAFKTATMNVESAARAEATRRGFSAEAVDNLAAAAKSKFTDYVNQIKPQDLEVRNWDKVANDIHADMKKIFDAAEGRPTEEVAKLTGPTVETPAASAKPDVPGGTPSPLDNNMPKDLTPVSEKTVNPELLKTIDTNLPALSQLIQNQSFPVSEQVLNTQLRKAVALHNEATVNGEDPGTAQIAAVKSFTEGINAEAKASALTPAGKTPPAALAEALKVPPAQMTPKLYERTYGQGRPTREVYLEHRDKVVQALANSETVPPEVINSHANIQYDVEREHGRRALNELLKTNNLTDQTMVHLVNALTLDPAKYQADYGKPPEFGTTVMGRTTTEIKRMGGRLTFVVELANGSNKKTALHEGYHVLHEALLNTAEQQLILKRYGNEEKAADAFAEWRSHRKGQPTGVIQRVFKSFDTLLNRFKNFMEHGTFKTADDIFDHLYKGKLADRAEKIGGAEAKPKYAAQDNLARAEDDARRDIEARAIAEFGTTDNLGNAGFILSNGQMLDFRGAKKVRFNVHRDVAMIYPLRGGAGTGELHRFMHDTGAVRVLFYEKPGGTHLSMETHGPISTEQTQQIEAYLEKNKVATATLSVVDEGGQEIRSKQFSDVRGEDVQRFFNPNERYSAEKGQAQFIGWMDGIEADENGPTMPAIALFNLPSGTTVTEVEVRAAGLTVPEHPSFEEWKANPQKYSAEGGDAQEPMGDSDATFDPEKRIDKAPLNKGLEGLNLEDVASRQIVREARLLRDQAIDSMDPIAKFVSDNGKLRPFKSEGGATPEIEEFRNSVPVYLRSFDAKLGRPVDEMAQEAFSAGLIEEPTSNALYERLSALPRKMPRAADYLDQAKEQVRAQLQDVERAQPDLKKEINRQLIPSRKSLPKLYTERAALRRSLQAQSLAAAAALQSTTIDLTKLKLETGAALRDTLPDELAKNYLEKLARVNTPEQARALIKRARLAADAYLKKQEISSRLDDLKERRQERADLSRLFQRQEAVALAAAKFESGRIAEIQKMVVGMIEKNLPLEIRGKFLNVVRSARTAQDYLLAGAKIDQALTNWQKKTLLHAIQRDVQRIQASQSIAIDYRDKVNALLNGLLFQKPRSTTLGQLGDLRRYIQKQTDAGHDITVPHYILESLQALSAKPLSEMSVADLEHLHNEINILAELGKTKFRVKTELERLAVERAIDDIRQTVKPLSQKTLESHKFGQKLPAMAVVGNMVKSALNKFTMMDLAITPMDVLFDMMDGTMNFNGPLFRTMKSPVDRAWTEYLRFKEALFNELAERAKGLDDAAFERIGVYAVAQQEGGIQKLMNSGISPEEIEAVKLSTKEMAFYEFMRARLDGTRPLVAEVMRREYNQVLGKVDDYFPFITDYSQHELKDVQERMLIDVQGKSTSFKPGLTKDRVGPGRQKVLINAFEIYKRHMDDVAYLVKMAGTVRHLGKIANHPRFLEAVGDIGHYVIQEWIDTLAKKGGSVGGQQVRALDIFRNNVGTAQLALKLSTFFVQYLAINQGTSTIGLYAYKGLANIMSDPEWRKFVKTNMPEVVERGGDDPEITEFTTGTKRLKELAFMPIQRADYFAASAIASGAYERYMNVHNLPIDLDEPNADAIEYAQREVRRTQAGTSFKDLPQALSRGALTGNRSIDRILFQFQNFALNEWSVIRHEGFRNIGKGNVGQGLMALLGVVIAAVAESAYRMKLSDLIQMMFGWQAEERPTDAGPLNPLLNHLPNDFSKKVALSIIQKVPLASSALSYWTYDSLPAPVLETLAKTAKGIRGYAKSKDPMGQRRNLIRAVGGVARLGGIPGTAQAEELAKYAFTDPFQKKLTAEQAAMKARKRVINQQRFQMKLDRQKQQREALKQ